MNDTITLPTGGGGQEPDDPRNIMTGTSMEVAPQKGLTYDWMTMGAVGAVVVKAQDVTGSIPEAQLAKKLGVPQVRLTKLRQDGQWYRETKRGTGAGRVFWTSAGVVRLEEQFKVKLLPVDPYPSAEQLVVHRPHFPNSRVMECRQGDKLVMVRVKDSRNYKAGMTIKAIRDGSMWNLVGRAPRWVGRW